MISMQRELLNYFDRLEDAKMTTYHMSKGYPMYRYQHLSMELVGQFCSLHLVLFKMYISIRPEKRVQLPLVKVQHRVSHVGRGLANLETLLEEIQDLTTEMAAFCADMAVPDSILAWAMNQSRKLARAMDDLDIFLRS